MPPVVVEHRVEVVKEGVRAHLERHLTVDLAGGLAAVDAANVDVPARLAQIDQQHLIVNAAVRRVAQVSTQVEPLGLSDGVDGGGCLYVLGQWEARDAEVAAIEQDTDAGSAPRCVEVGLEAQVRSTGWVSPVRVFVGLLDVHGVASASPRDQPQQCVA